MRTWWQNIIESPRERGGVIEAKYVLTIIVLSFVAGLILGLVLR